MSLHQPVLPALPAQPKRFSSSGLPRKATQADIYGLADCSSTFQELGGEEFLFRRPLELTLNSGAEMQLLMELSVNGAKWSRIFLPTASSQASPGLLVVILFY